MKPSNLKTPRTLSECSFDVGYTTHTESDGHWSDLAIAIIAVAVCAMFVLGVI